MGCRKSITEEETAAAISDALLLATMCIIGLPVDVHVKDGSVYSGIFHTACVDDNYAIVLKKAMMVKKGSRRANVDSGCVIETLVILSEDLAQVVAKGITLSADGVPGYIKGNGGGAIADYIASNEGAEREAKSVKPNRSNVETLLLNGKRGAQDSMKDQQANASTDLPLVSSVKFDQKCEQRIREKSNLENHHSPATTTPAVPDVSSKTCLSSSNSQTDVVPPRSSSCNKAAKESKLNPGAKIFRPSLGHHRAVNPPIVPTVAYIPESCPVIPVASPEPEVEITPFAPRSSVPLKLCNNAVAGNGNIDVQYAQPPMGYVGSRTAPTRYANQYHQLQAGTGYMHPNSENVMVGRLGPVVYVHPVSHGVVQSVSGFSQVSSCPLLNPLHANLPKHQGNTTAQTLPLCMTPPFVPGAQQTYTIPSQVPVSHPSFPVLRPIQVPGPNGYFNHKFV